MLPTKEMPQETPPNAAAQLPPKLPQMLPETAADQREHMLNKMLPTKRTKKLHTTPVMMRTKKPTDVLITCEDDLGAALQDDKVLAAKLPGETDHTK